MLLLVFLVVLMGCAKNELLLQGPESEKQPGAVLNRLDLSLVREKHPEFYGRFRKAVEIVDGFIRERKFFTSGFEVEKARLKIRDDRLYLNGEEVTLTRGSLVISMIGMLSPVIRMKPRANAAPGTLSFRVYGSGENEHHENGLFYDRFKKNIFKQESDALGMARLLCHEIVHVVQFKRDGAGWYYSEYAMNYGPCIPSAGKCLNAHLKGNRMRADGAAVIVLLVTLLAAGCAKPYIELRGCILDAVTEKPIGPGARVSVFTTTRSFSNSSDSEGKFTVRYAVADRDEASDLAAWLLVVEAPRHESKIIPMFRPVRLFGYYLRRRVKIRLNKRSNEKPSTTESLPKELRKDPLASDEAIKRIHALSKYVYLDSLQKRAKANGNADLMDGYAPGHLKRNDFIGALAAHMVADKSSALRRDAARVAWRWNSPEIVHALMVALDDKNSNVRYWASRSLQKISSNINNTLYRDDDEKIRGEKIKGWWEWYERRDK
jgi:hypothetical protein